MSATPAIAEPASATPAATEASTAPVVAASTVAEPATAPSATNGSKRARWTRETIISELASWIVSGTAIDAAFLKRHGPPGLVPATLRIFGRFDAAMNVAGLHVARLYPDGPAAR